MQDDGNLVLYGNNNGKAVILWASNTMQKGTGPWNLTLQDGNLVIKDAREITQWQEPNNTGSQGPFELNMQNDGNVVLYDKNKMALWATNTVGI